ncbi:Uncharacterised protein [[Clostridium] sordellii]|uniref:hypothetical protein n=1 Tax=Paraclostridium sordellii TaxID=1505 RepID=UPI0005E609B7|nr:hypothetical protein [Paeniclostridium sordellii]CEQ01673.1 Uncharacterised protein [[Clostridium] sordellii] [Paeniclostridium sordellii]
MEKYIRIITPGEVEDMRTRKNYEYEPGDEIILNNKTHCKCMQILKEENKIIYVFKAAKIKYDYSW